MIGTVAREYPAHEEDWVQPAAVRVRTVGRRLWPALVLLAAWLLVTWLRRRRTR
jgi:hypothetical protein